MTKTYRFVVEVEATEIDRLLHTENLRLALADAADSQITVTAVRVDGREFDAVHGTLEETPITPEISEMIMTGRKVQAIIALRKIVPGLGLGDAKKVVDDWAENR